MCGIFGILTTQDGSNTPHHLHNALVANTARGRDAHGFTLGDGSLDVVTAKKVGAYTDAALSIRGSYNVAIGNTRAEPTTEYVEGGMAPEDIQPYTEGGWSIVHNGTIANDKQIIQTYGLGVPPTRIDSWVIAALFGKLGVFPWREVIGSYAIIAHQHGTRTLHFYTNYRPLYRHMEKGTVILTSEPMRADDYRIPAYSWGTYEIEGDQIIERINEGALYPGSGLKERALVVFSGGLDSTVAAAKLKHDGYEVDLLHFDYGCRATGPERAAVEAIAAHLDVPLHIVSTDVFTAVIGGSKLTNTGSNVAMAEGEAGAEYAHEWVPARNLILTSIALGIAESKGFDVLALGANMEEAGAYPDNEPEFLRSFQRLIPYAVSDGKRIRIETPVGNLMKKEIVKLGLEIDAPMHLSWSCYNAQSEPYIPDTLRQHITGVDGAPVEVTGIGTPGERRFRHCGHCGPCYMRKKAFEINGEKDPVFD